MIRNWSSRFPRSLVVLAVAVGVMSSACSASADAQDPESSAESPAPTLAVSTTDVFATPCPARVEELEALAKDGPLPFSNEREGTTATVRVAGQVQGTRTCAAFDGSVTTIDLRRGESTESDAILDEIGKGEQVIPARQGGPQVQNLPLPMATVAGSQVTSISMTAFTEGPPTIYGRWVPTLPTEPASGTPGVFLSNEYVTCTAAFDAALPSPLTCAPK